MTGPDFRGAFVAVAVIASLVAIGAWEGCKFVARHVRVEINAEGMPQ